jgi:hypothetical protein
MLAQVRLDVIDLDESFWGFTRYVGLVQQRLRQTT